MACSQHGRRYALTASLLQMAQRSFAGMSSCARELISSSCASVRASDAAMVKACERVQSKWSASMIAPDKTDLEKAHRKHLGAADHAEIARCATSRRLLGADNSKVTTKGSSRLLEKGTWLVRRLVGRSIDEIGRKSMRQKWQKWGTLSIAAGWNCARWHAATPFFGKKAKVKKVEEEG